jgi:hypothetical protein
MTNILDGKAKKLKAILVYLRRDAGSTVRL